MYSGKEYCSAVSTIGLSEDKMWRQVWSKFVPTNVSVPVWRALHGRIATLDELNKRGVQMIESSVCVLCTKETESVDHLFCRCQFSWNIWQNWCQNFNISLVLPGNFRTLFLSWINSPVCADEVGIYVLSLLRIGHWAKCNWPRSIPSISDFIRFLHVAVTDSDQNFDRSFSCCFSFGIVWGRVEWCCSLRFYSLWNSLEAW
ncbi:hypothetical protein V6N13_100344 [Hibiscus sabdariffa]